MNTKNKQDQKKSQHKTQQGQGPKEQGRKKQGQEPTILHEQELPETRMFR